VPSPYYDEIDPARIRLPDNRDVRESRFENDWSRQIVTGIKEPGLREFLRIYYATVRLLDDQVATEPVEVVPVAHLVLHLALAALAGPDPDAGIVAVGPQEHDFANRAVVDALDEDRRSAWVSGKTVVSNGFVTRDSYHVAFKMIPTSF
jgi:hypothetical protein